MPLKFLKELVLTINPRSCFQKDGGALREWSKSHISMTCVGGNMFYQLGKVHPSFRNKLMRGKQKVFQKRHVKNKAIGINLNSRYLADKFALRSTKQPPAQGYVKQRKSPAQLSCSRLPGYYIFNLATLEFCSLQFGYVCH